MAAVPWPWPGDFRPCPSSPRLRGRPPPAQAGRAAGAGAAREGPCEPRPAAPHRGGPPGPPVPARPGATAGRPWLALPGAGTGARPGGGARPGLGQRPAQPRAAPVGAPQHPLWCPLGGLRRGQRRPPPGDPLPLGLGQPADGAAHGPRWLGPPPLAAGLGPAPAGSCDPRLPAPVASVQPRAGHAGCRPRPGPGPAGRPLRRGDRALGPWVLWLRSLDAARFGRSEPPFPSTEQLVAVIHAAKAEVEVRP